MSLPHIPVLRRGTTYQSLDRSTLLAVGTGRALAELSLANSGMIRRDLTRMGSAREALSKLTTDQLLAICKEAGRHFLETPLPVGDDDALQSPQDYLECLSATSGLPHSLCRQNMGKIHQVFTQMPTILRGLTRAPDFQVLDHGFADQDGIPVCYFPVTDCLGAVLPSNSPGVNSLWMPAVALKIPVVLKPGREEPWTPLRIIRAFIAAGCPPEAFSFYPTDHEGGDLLLRSCERALVFGDESTVERYAANPGIQVHGPGRSKILLGEDAMDRWPEFLDVMVDSIVNNGGRSCVNASAILAPAKGRQIAAALAERLATFLPLPAADERAALAGFANPKMAEHLEATLAEGLAHAGAEEVTAKYREGPRVATVEGLTYLLPTLVYCNTFEHPLANREFLFPYCSLVEMPQEQMLKLMGPSLVVTALTADPRFERQLLASPLIDRLNLGPVPTSQVRWDQPHEGNLFEFLYRRRAIQQVPL